MDQENPNSVEIDEPKKIAQEKDKPSGEQSADPSNADQPQIVEDAAEKAAQHGGQSPRGSPSSSNRGSQIWKIISNIGQKITERPINKIYILLVIVIPTAVVYIKDVFPWIRPTPSMAGEFNVAVAPFTVLDPQGNRISNRDGQIIADFVYKRLETSFSSLDSQTIRYEIRGPDKTDEVRGVSLEERAKSAAEIAERINAHILIYGTIQKGEESELYPEFHVNYLGFEQFDEIKGTHKLGSPLWIKLPFEETQIQDLENPALSIRVNALSLIVIGLAYDAKDKLAQAITYYHQAETIKGWLPNAGKDVLYLIMGNAYLRIASIEKKTSYLPNAEQAYQTALEINPGYVRALMGMGGVTYLRALGDPYQESADSVDLKKLQEAEEYFLRVLETRALPEGLNIAPKAHFNLGQIDLVRAQFEDTKWLKKAQDEFLTVIEEYEAGNEHIQEMAAQSYARIALAYRMQGELEIAVEYYQKAIAKSSPYYKAYYNSRMGELYAEQGQIEKSIAALEEAIKISEFNGDITSFERYTQELNALKDKSH